MESINVIEDFFSHELYQQLLEFTDRCPMFPCQKSHVENDPHGHWVLGFSKTGRLNDKDATDNLPAEILPAWRHVQSVIEHKSLITCYMNGHTYGTEGYFHRDTDQPNHTTVIIYLLRDEWDPDWGGETVFIDDNKIIRGSIFPKTNRVVIFPSNLRHCARGVTRKFNGIRKTLMFKTRLEINTPE